MPEVVDCLVLGGIDLELHHASAPRNSFKNVGEDYVEELQYVMLLNIQNVERRLAVEHAHVFCRQLQ